MNDTHDANKLAATPPFDATLPRLSAKRDKFHKLAVPRTKRVIKAIRILANMGGKNRYAYEFAEADVEKIYETLKTEVEQLRIVMVAPGRQLDIEFDL